MWPLIVIAFFVAFIALCLLSAVPLFKRHSLKEAHTPAECGLFYEPVCYSTEDRILLRGFWFPADRSKRTIIMLHGYAGSLDPDLRYVPHLHSAGFNILMFDFRAHGRSGGLLTSMGALERRDVKAAVKFVKMRGSDWIGLLGFSMGGRTALISAPQIPEIRALISDGGPLRLSTAVVQELHRRKISYPVACILSRMMLIGGSLLSVQNLFKIDPYNAAKDLVNIPVLLINGERDLYTSKYEIEKVMRDAGPNTELWSVPEAKHRNIEDSRPDEYLQRILAFFTKHSAGINAHGENDEEN